MEQLNKYYETAANWLNYINPFAGELVQGPIYSDSDSDSTEENTDALHTTIDEDEPEVTVLQSEEVSKSASNDEDANQQVLDVAVKSSKQVTDGTDGILGLGIVDNNVISVQDEVVNRVVNDSNILSDMKSSSSPQKQSVLQKQKTELETCLNEIAKIQRAMNTMNLQELTESVAQAEKKLFKAVELRKKIAKNFSETVRDGLDAKIKESKQTVASLKAAQQAKAEAEVVDLVVAPVVEIADSTIQQNVELLDESTQHVLGSDEVVVDKQLDADALQHEIKPVIESTQHTIGSDNGVVDNQAEADALVVGIYDNSKQQRFGLSEEVFQSALGYLDSKHFNPTVQNAADDNSALKQKTSTKDRAILLESSPVYAAALKEVERLKNKAKKVDAFTGFFWGANYKAKATAAYQALLDLATQSNDPEEAVIAAVKDTESPLYKALNTHSSHVFKFNTSPWSSKARALLNVEKVIDDVQKAPAVLFNTSSSI